MIMSYHDAILYTSLMFYSNLLSNYDGYDLSLGTVDSTSTCSHMYNLLND